MKIEDGTLDGIEERKQLFTLTGIYEF